MMTRKFLYYGKYKNLIGDHFEIKISKLMKDAYSPIPLEIKATANLEYASQNSILSPIRGSGLSIEIEADNDMDFQDLHTGNETDVSVEFFRNQQKIFDGFVKPDGLYADFVSEKWNITLEAIDGLSTLDNLSFVDENGLHFQGLMTEIDIIYNCLKRTTLSLPIFTRIDYLHSGVVGDIPDVLANTQLNTERFYKDADEGEEKEIMDCGEVLKSILEKYNAVIMQFDANWYIFQPQVLHDDYDILNPENKGVYSFKKYDTDNNNIGTFEIPTHHKFGSEIDQYYPHHINENQRFTLNGAVSAFRVKYKYGFVKSLAGDLTFNQGNPNWNVGGNARFTYQDDLYLKWDYDPNDANWNGVSNDYELELANTIDVEVGDRFDIKINSLSSGMLRDFNFVIKLTTPSNGVFYLAHSIITHLPQTHVTDEWRDTFAVTRLGPYTDYEIVCDEGYPDERSATIRIGTGEETETTYTIPEIEHDGTLEIQLFRPRREEIPSEVSSCFYLPYDSYAYLYSLELTPVTEAKIKEGEKHTAYRSPSTSSNVEDSIEVYNGDLTSDVYVGAISRMDGGNTSSWHRRSHPSEDKEILRIMVEDRIRVQSKPQKVFSGDMYGYFRPFGVMQINNLSGKFFLNSYIYRTNENIISYEAAEFFNENLENQIEYEKTFDRGQVVKPTIK